MEKETQKIKITVSALWSAALVAVFVAAITIAGELYAPLKDWLKETFSHHWLGKSVLSGLLFAVLFVIFLLKERDLSAVNRSLKATFWLSAAGASAILIFYLYEVLLAH